MISNEYDGLKRLKIPLVKWGSNYRVKVRNQHGITTFISNVQKPSSIKLIAKYYKKSEARVKSAIEYEYRPAKSYTPFYGSTLESHEFSGFSQDEVYTKVREFLMKQTKSVKVNVQLGYRLIDRTTGLERDYWPSNNTAIWDKPIAVNSKRDVDSKIMSYMHAKDFTEKISYPASSFQLKEINSAKIVIYYRDHELGDSNIVIPNFIKNNSFVINFPKTENKCMFYCIAYHLIEGDKPARDRMVKHAKQRVSEYCAFEGIQYSPSVFKDFKPIDIMQFDKLEDCFKINIEVFGVDEDTLRVSNIRPSDKSYNNTINILDYKGHAMYITDLQVVLSKFPCNVCGMVFETSVKLHNHKKMKCEFETIDSFCKKPTLYNPNTNRLKSLLAKYKINGVDHYMDHFIVYDFEAILLPIEQPKVSAGEKDPSTKFTTKHQAVSVSICDSLTKQVKCFVNPSTRALLEDTFAYILEVSGKIEEYNVSKFARLIRRMNRDDARLAKLIDSEKDAEKLAILGKIKKNVVKEIESLKEACAQAPVIGFNSGRYDINLNKNDLFAVIGTENIKMVIKNPSYMCIATNSFKMLDIRNYLPPGTSYEKYLETYLGGCICDDKTRCVCGLTKGHFCYEYIDSFEKLNETGLPPQSAFDSKFRDTKISDSDYERLKFVWDRYQMKNVKDLLIWYNNLDVEPFVKAIQKQRQFYKRFGLDMLVDAVSLPGLAEKVMYQSCYEEADKIIVEGGFKKSLSDDIETRIEDIMNRINPADDMRYYRFVSDDRYAGCAYIKMRDSKERNETYLFTHRADAKYVMQKLENEFGHKVIFELDLSKLDAPFSFPSKRITGYKQQDKAANRECTLTVEEMDYVLKQSCFVCLHCLCPLTSENVSADRIDNSEGHNAYNVMASCYECNVARKNMNIDAFRRKKRIEANGHNLGWSIDEEQKDIYHKMKANIAGGPSIIFNRFAKRNETFIRDGSKLCKKIIGYDANALYLWALGNVMPCGRLTSIETYDGIIDDIKSDKLFGFLECDIETPDHLKDYFSEMTPIFKNIEIDTSREDIIGKHMFDTAIKQNRAPTKSRKLIGSYFGEKILIYAPLLKWYLAHGLVVTKTYSFIKANANRAFKPFMDQVSNARREGDVDKSKAMIAEMMKLIGNSAFGRSGMDKSKHKEVSYESGSKTVRQIIEKQNFHDVEELNGAYEVSLKKRRIKLNNPIHLSIAIYQLAKLRMLEFYYDCIDFYFDRSDFQYQEMDTDSAYIAFSDDNPFQDLIKPELAQHFEDHKYDWFPRDDTKENAAFDRRTPGLFKEEWRGNAMVSLSSKNYYCYLPEEVSNEKCSSKGVQKHTKVNQEKSLNQAGFEDVVHGRKFTIQATNRGFRIDKKTQSVVTYEQHKTGLSYWYDKRQVLADGISTIPLMI